MTDLLAARLDMALSLAFHILFAAAGIGMPLLMAVSEWRWLRTRDPIDLELTRRWLKGTAILFAVGAVSGTMLSFELGLLWPRFMQWAGPVIGMPFSLEGFAFFLEGVFIGIYLYGWDKVPPRAHWFAGLVIAVSGCLSGIFVVCANAWMNTPTGFRLVDGRATDIQPFVAMLNPAAFQQGLHMTIAAYLAVSAAAAGIHALLLLRDPSDRFHRRALAIVLPVAGVAALLQPLSGDLSARQVARWQPLKLAALEGQWATERGAPLRIGGLPDERAEVTRGAIEIPRGLSLLAFHDPNATVTGLQSVAREDRPPVAIVHVAFQLMVACATALGAVTLWGVWLAWRTRALPTSRRFLAAVVAVSPLGLLAIEAGWVVTEVGRQPWIVYHVMRTRDAVTPMPGMIVPLTAIAVLYLFLGVVVFALLKRQMTAPYRGGTTREPDDARA